MDHPDFRVNNRIFATLTHDEKLGMVSLTSKRNRGSCVSIHPPSRRSTARGDCKERRGSTSIWSQRMRFGEAMTLAWRLAVAKGTDEVAIEISCGKPAKPAKPRAQKQGRESGGPGADTDVQGAVAPYPHEVQALAKATRALMVELLPKVKETIDSTGPYIHYSYGPGYKGVVGYITVNQKGVKLGVARGSSLPDPNGLLQGTGKANRHVVDRHAIRSPDARPASAGPAAHAEWKKEHA